MFLHVIKKSGDRISGDTVINLGRQDSGFGRHDFGQNNYGTNRDYIRQVLNIAV